MIRRLVITLLFAVLNTVAAAAADITLTWDPMPTGQTWQAVRIYELVNGTPTKVGEVAVANGLPNRITLTGVVPGVHTYTARSVDPQWGESTDSNQATTNPANGAPTGFKITVTVTVQGP
jgi:hypothetical protein